MEIHCAGLSLGRPLVRQGRLLASSLLKKTIILSSISTNEGDARTIRSPTKTEMNANHTPPQIPAPSLPPSPRGPPTMDRNRHLRWPTVSVMNKMKRNMGQFSGGPLTLLGIESRSTVTGVAVVNESRRVLGQSLLSQIKDHRESGRIAPLKAADIHRDNLEQLTQLTLEKSGRSLDEVGGIAVTVGPGFPTCLREGIMFAQKLALKAKKPLIPIHHLEAHALIPRIERLVPFPYLVLVGSGGDCILAVVQGIGKFSLLGKNLDGKLGEVLMKVVRMMRLDLHPEVQDLSEGAAIEHMALKGDSRSTLRLLKTNAQIMHNVHCCNFSFAGIGAATHRFVIEAVKDGWDEESPIPRCEEISATIQDTVVTHLVMRTHRAIKYCKRKWPSVNTLVVSGGMASNKSLCGELQKLTSYYRYQLVSPPSHLCTNNGVMIAWAGIERLKAMDVGKFKVGRKQEGTGVCWTAEEQGALEPLPTLPLGTDISDEVKEMNLKLPRSVRKKIAKQN